MICTEICREGQKLLADQPKKGINGGVTEEVVIGCFRCSLRRQCKITPGFRDIDFISFHRCVIAMMSMMRYLPTEVWCPEEGMDYLEA